MLTTQSILKEAAELFGENAYMHGSPDQGDAFFMMVVAGEVFMEKTLARLQAVMRVAAREKSGIATVSTASTL